jgi:hypothetical protein
MQNNKENVPEKNVSLTANQFYVFFIIISTALILGRIFAVDRIDVQKLQETRLRQAYENYQKAEAAGASPADLQKKWEKLYHDAVLESPMLSGNDRSRWCTIRALVEPDMRVIRTVKDNNGKEHLEYVWYAIDKVQNIRGWDTIDMVKHPLPDQPDIGYLYSSKPNLLPTVMAIPYALLYWGSGQTITLQTQPYLVIRLMLIILHVIPLLLTWILLFRLLDRFAVSEWSKIYCAGFLCFGTFLSTFCITLNNHLPAVFCITAALYCVVRIIFDGKTQLRYFFCAGFFGFFAVTCELPALAFFGLLGLVLLYFYPRQTLTAGVAGALLVVIPFFATNYVAHQTLRPAYSMPEWYQYEYERGGVVRQSYWKNPVGIDRGEPSRLTYIFNSTLGHHGIFSLTPVWFLAFAGLGLWLYSKDKRLRFAGGSILLLTLIVFGFYMLQKQPNRNYGGMSCALRWTFWLIPLWIIPLAAAADRISKSAAGRGIALFLLAVSVISAVYPVWNPWSQPWLYRLFVYLNLPVI